MPRKKLNTSSKSSTPADHMPGASYSSTESQTGQVEAGEPNLENRPAWDKLAPAEEAAAPLVPKEILRERNPITGRPVDRDA